MTLVDASYHELVLDFCSLYSPQELQEPFIEQYIQTLVARWGRWERRGRAPAMCFEAASSGAIAFLQKQGLSPTELTNRADRLLAYVLAGIVIDSVEPKAREHGQDGAVRQKAIQIVADEFLARAAAPRLANVFFGNVAGKTTSQKAKL